jgi:S-adenosylmethionine-diacylgycerolhomoserine-N-methlytransferase
MRDAAARMDHMYRRQRHIYDASRKFYLLGRDETINRLRPARGSNTLEIGCGTGRNLIKLAQAYPQAQLFGLDVSQEMLTTAGVSAARAGFASRIVLAQADATAFDSQKLFGCANFERVMVSYALSMIPRWREALSRALDVVVPGGSLHIVDFGDCAGLPHPFKAGLRRWLAAFDVTPRDDFCAALTALTAERGMTCEIESCFRGYAILAVARR